TSAITLAGLWHYLGRDGVAILYSWPGGSGYGYSQEGAGFTQFHLREFLKVLGSSPDLERVHLDPDTRGRGVLANALRDVLRSSGSDVMNAQKELKLDTVVLAAPDFDVDTYGPRLSGDRLRFVPRRLVIYMGQGDAPGGTTGWFLGSVSRL